MYHCHRLDFVLELGQIEFSQNSHSDVSNTSSSKCSFSGDLPFPVKKWGLYSP